MYSQKLTRTLCLLISFLCLHFAAQACHGLALLNYDVKVTDTSVIVNGDSDPGTCGCGPYYLEVQLDDGCSTFDQDPPDCNSSAWNTFPFYRSTLNTPSENCVLEHYFATEILFRNLKAGVTYYLRSREHVCGSNSVGPWQSVVSFTTPGAPKPRPALSAFDVHVSLDKGCQRILSISDFWPNYAICPKEYSIAVSYPFGTNTHDPSNVLDRSHLGYKMVYSITDLITGNKTWAYLTVEDKKAPDGGCRDRSISCFELIQLNKIVENVVDNCSEKATASITKLSFEDFGCNDPTRLGIVHRTILTSDAWGNTMTCSDNITIIRDSLELAKCPDPIQFSCNTSCLKVNADGSVSNAPTQMKFSSDPKDPFYPSPELLLNLQNPKKWRDPLNNELPCLDPSILAVPSICKNPGLDFDGFDDLVYRFINVNEDEFTVEFWFKTNNPNTGMFSVQAEIGGHDRHVYLMNGDVCARVWNDQTIHTTGTNYADGNWHHVAYVLGTSISGNRLYLDGQLKASGDKAYSDFDWQDLIYIGFSDDASSPNFEGQMDEFRIWTVARSQAQIQANMKREVFPQANLQLYYKFNEGTPAGNNTGIHGTIDDSGNDQPGSLNNFNQNGPGSNWIEVNGTVTSINGTVTSNCTPMYPGLGGYCKTFTTYKDEIIPICGGGFKIRREWIITDWCTGQEKVCVQYIAVEDKEAPKVKPVKPILTSTGPHDCLASVSIPKLAAEDCGEYDQTYTISTTDALGRPTVLTGTLPATITIPSGDLAHSNKACYRVEVKTVDRCFNETITLFSICVSDLTPPTPVCDEITQATVDPATCWARIYAVDLDNGSRDNCCNLLHFAIAKMADIDAATKSWEDYWKATCLADRWKYKSDYDNFLSDYINCIVFKDYIDLTECGSNQVVLRVYEACGVPRYDPHVFPCSEHDWFTYNTFIFCRAWHNYNFFHPKGSRSCDSKPTNWCRADWIAWFNKVSPETPHSPIAQAKPSNPKTSDSLNLYFTYYPGGDDLVDIYANHDCFFVFSPVAPADNSEEAPGNRCSRRLYNDCMVNVLVDDKTPPVCEAPPVLFWYCDNVATSVSDGIYETAAKACDRLETMELPNFICTKGDGSPYKEIEDAKENDGELSDTLDGTKAKFYGYYGCQSQSGHPNEEHGTPTTPCQDAGSWSPIYCRSWLILDKNDQAGKVDVRNSFYSPVKRSGGRGADVTGSQFIIWDNCWLGEVTSADDHYVDQCGNGWWQRTWTAKDKCGASVTCSQKIYTKHRTDFEVMFPSDLTIACDANAGTGPDGQAGRPMIMDDECELVGVSYDDVRFDIVPDACYKIVRTWKLIDWCQYDPNAHKRDPEVIVDDRFVANPETRGCVYRKVKDNGDGYMEYVQIIKVIDNKRPTIVCPKNDTLCINAGYDGKGDEPDPMCTVPSYTSPDFKATDNCAQPNEISFRYEVSTDQISWIKSAPNQSKFSSKTLGEGLTYVRVIAEDNCGQEDTCVFTVLVKDCKKPTPYCYNGIATVIMPTSGSVVVWATDLNAGSYDNCTKKKDLSFAFDKDFANSSKTFTCKDIPNGISATVPVNIYVKDKAGNVDYCNTYLLIQDGSGNICPDNASITGSIAGKVATETQEPIENVTLDAKSSNAIPAFKTNLSGEYSYTSLPIKTDYSIVPVRDDDPMNGLSTIDLVLIQKHILGIQNLDSPYKLIAADADRNNDISVLDLLELRKLILTVYDKLPNNTSWRFIPLSYTFTDPNSPWGFPEQIDIKGLSQDEINRDFVGVKVGDVNGTVTPHSLMGAEARSEGASLKFKVEDKFIKSGEETTVEFKAENFNNIEGYQFSLALKGLEVKGINSGVLKVNENNFGMSKLGNGYVTTSWNDSKGVSANANEVLFSVRVKATRDMNLSDGLVINSKYTRAEAYHGAETIGVSLAVGKNSAAGYALNQNTPDPFNATTMITYEMAKADKVTLKITDVTGKTIKVYPQDAVKGINQKSISRSELGTASGVLYYTIETKDYRATKKMILID